MLLPDPLLEWPPSMPPFSAGFAVQGDPAIAAFQPTTGPTKIRRRSTFERRYFSVQLEINGDQLADLEEFWTDIKNGADPFTAENPQTGGDSLWFFKQGKKFTITNLYGAVAQDGKTSAQLRQYQVNCDLELLGDAP